MIKTSSRHKSRNCWSRELNKHSKITKHLCRIWSKLSKINNEFSKVIRISSTWLSKQMARSSNLSSKPKNWNLKSFRFLVTTSPRIWLRKSSHNKFQNLKEGSNVRSRDENATIKNIWRNMATSLVSQKIKHFQKSTSICSRRREGPMSTPNDSSQAQSNPSPQSLKKTRSQVAIHRGGSAQRQSKKP